MLTYPALRETAPLIREMSREEKPYRTWVRAASQVIRLVTAGGYGVGSLLYADELQDRPYITATLGLAAGSIGPFVASRIDPHKIETLLYKFESQFDVLVYLALTFGGELTDTIPHLRAIWVPLIFFHEGAVLTWVCCETWKETKDEFQDDSSVRPLLEGNVRGSIKPFLIKGAVFFTAGVVAAVAGRVLNHISTWRLGFISAGIGLGIPIAQPAYAALQKALESYFQLSTAERMVNGVPLKQRLLALLARMIPSIGKAGLAVAGTFFFLFPKFVKELDFRYALFNLPIGLFFAMTDVGQQHRFQYSQEVASDLTPSCSKRAVNEIKKRPGIYAGALATISFVGTLLLARTLVPSLGSSFEALLILGGTAATFSFAKGVNALSPPGKNRIRNQINFRATCSSHLFALVFFALMSSDAAEVLSPFEIALMWSVCGAYIGIFLKELMD
jgi:hypothetical protein